MAVPGVHARTQDGVRVLTLDAPPVNAMSNALLETLDERLHELAEDDTVRAVVLTGGGEKAFAAGADLAELERMVDDPAAVEHHTRLTRRTFGRLATVPQPVIAAVQASAVGGGFELALACDLIVVDPGARLGLPEVRLGLIPGAGGTQRLPRRIGRRAAWWILRGRLMPAAEALALGAVDAIAEPGAVLRESEDLAAELAGLPAKAVQAAKAVLRGGADLPLAAGLDLEMEAFREMLGTAEAREGVRAFLSRRAP